MLDRIARALVWVLNLFPLTRRTRPGRHSARYLAEHPAPVTAPAPVSPWSLPWTGPSAEEARAIFRAEETKALTPERRERFFATAWAERGYDYPYAAEGVHQVRTAVSA
ncbi:hypothetical protein ACWF94_06610 [Streptomyces sp. NPDC055078]